MLLAVLESGFIRHRQQDMESSWDLEMKEQPDAPTICQPWHLLPAAAAWFWSGLRSELAAAHPELRKGGIIIIIVVVIAIEVVVVVLLLIIIIIVIVVVVIIILIGAVVFVVTLIIITINQAGGAVAAVAELETPELHSTCCTQIASGQGKASRLLSFHACWEKLLEQPCLPT